MNEKKTPSPAEIAEPVVHESRVRDSLYLNAAHWAANVLASTLTGSLAWELTDLIPGKRAERKKTIHEQTTELVKELSRSGVDPVVFDVLLSNEINRRMKVQFGVTFLVFTFLFTAVSYAIVVLDGVYKWGISPVAITALIIETPIQFVGLLYIIARNLFPNAPAPKVSERISRAQSNKVKKTEA